MAARCWPRAANILETASREARAAAKGDQNGEENEGHAGRVREAVLDE